jgi:hypothetical protein
MPTLKFRPKRGVGDDPRIAHIEEHLSRISEVLEGLAISAAGPAPAGSSGLVPVPFGQLPESYVVFDPTGGHDHNGVASHKVDHANLLNVTPNQHHAQAHALNGADHTLAGATAGDVLTALTPTTFGFVPPSGPSGGPVLESSVVFDPVAGHDHNGVNSHKVDHANLLNVSPNQHHAQAHALNGGDHTLAGGTPGDVLTVLSGTTFGFVAPAPPTGGPVLESSVVFDPVAGHDHNGVTSHKVDHANLLNVSPNQHHSQAHAINGADHTLAGGTPGDVLTVLSPTTFGFQTPAAGGGSPGPAYVQWIKVATKTYVDLGAAAKANDIQIYSLPAGAVLHGIKLKHSVAFGGGVLTGYTLSVGITGVLAKYASPFDVMQPPGNTIFRISGLVGSENHGAATSIRLAAASLGANLNQATAGTVDVWLAIGVAA